MTISQRSTSLRYGSTCESDVESVDLSPVENFQDMIVNSQSHSGSPRNHNNGKTRFPIRLMCIGILCVFCTAMYSNVANVGVEDLNPKNVIQIYDRTVVIDGGNLRKFKMFITGETLSMDQELDEEAVVHFRRICPLNSKIVLIFPHVNKAGGRTLEGTFADLDVIGSEARHRYVSLRPRSTTHRFDLLNGHKTYPHLAIKENCYRSKSVGFDCETTTESECKRWVFTLRDPVDRLVSSFYTAVGRNPSSKQVRLPRNPIMGGTGAFGDSHFYCKPGSKVAEMMKMPEFTIETFVRLPARERLACKWTHNLHVKYLAPDEKDNTKAQLELAKKRLRLMSWFGVLERWTESMQLFAYTFGTDLVHYVPTFNANTYNKTLSPLAKDTLRQMNMLDIELYKYALTLFEDRLAKMRLSTSDPFYNPNPFECDKKRICWDKTKAEEPHWNFDPQVNKEKFATPGEQKEKMICTFVEGCTRSDVIIKEIKDEEEKQEEAQAVVERPKSQCLGTFYILGARKGGTTSLYQYVSKHPDFRGVRLEDDAQSGELLFLHHLDPENKLTGPDIRRAYNQEFVKQLYRMYGNKQPHTQEPSLQEMRQGPWFENVKQGKWLTGESSVSNGPSCNIPRQMKLACGEDLRLVYLVRNPIERIISQYKMRARKGTLAKPTMTLDQYVRADLAAFEEKAGNKQRQLWGESPIPCLFKNDYENSIWASLYIVHISRWLREYPSNRLMVIQSETFLQSPAAVLGDVLDFIGLDKNLMNVEETVLQQYNTATNTNNNNNNNNNKNELSPELRKRLKTLFAPYNEKLAQQFPDVHVENWV